MSFINTIEDDSDQVELIVRQRFEAKPGCNIVGFDAYDQAGAVTELSTQLSSNSARIDGIISSLSDTDANVIALNSNLLTAIANTASNTVTNASLVSDLRSDVDSNSELISNLQANTVAITADLASNSALLSGLRTDLDANSIRVGNVETDLSSNATLLSNATARISVVEQNTSNLSNLTNTVSEHTTDILNLEQSVNLLDSIEGALDGNSSAITALSAAGVSWGLTIFNAIDKAASKVRVSSVESVLENQFGDDLANLTSGNTSSDVSADINALKDVVNLENWGNLLGVDVVLSSPGNIGAPLTSNVIRFNDALFGTSNTSVCQALKSNVSSLQAFQSNTANSLSNIFSELFTHDTLLALHSNELADNVVTISNLSSSLADNSSRISNLETANTGAAVWTTTSGSDIYYNSGNVGIGTNNPLSTLQVGDGTAPTTGDATGSISLYGTGATKSNGNRPGLYHRADVGLGLWSDAHMSFEVDGYNENQTEAMRILTSGNVGIGTTNPATYLHLSAKTGNPGATEGDFVGTHNLTEYLRFTGDGDSGDVNSVSVGFKVGADDNDNVNPDGRLDICANDGASVGNSYGQTPDKTIATFLGSGNVGIGTTSPQSALHVTGVVNYNNQNPPGVEMGVHASYYAAIEMTSITGQTGWIDFKTTSSNSDYVDRIRGGLGNLRFFTNSGGERMVINSSGNVGINNNSPSYKLDVSGDSRVVGKCIVQTNNSQNGVVCTGTDGGLSFYSHRDGDPGIKFTRTSVFTGEDNEYTLAILPCIGGTPRYGDIDLGSSSNYWRRTYTHTIHRSFESALSDDRIKTNETLVENATETLLKLKPQTYDKHLFEFDKFTEQEYSNVSSDNTVFSAHSNCWADQTELIENTIDEAEQFPYIRRRLTEQGQKETGLIAQDIYYDCPELRHLISLPSDATPAEEKPTGSDDPQEDPDYDGAGWGTQSASVSYTQLIPLLVKSNQELHERLVDHDAQITDLESANDAKQRRIDELEERVNALAARMEAVENA